MNQKEKKEERIAYLKTQALLFELKKDQVKKNFIEVEDKNYIQIIESMKSLEAKREKRQKDM